MGWLKRLLDLKDLKTLNLPPVRLQLTVRSQQLKLATESVPRADGLSGEYDQSGLAKRVALAFEDPQLDDIDSLRRSNRQCCGGNRAPSQEILNTMISVARGVNGATDVDTDQVAIGWTVLLVHTGLKTPSLDKLLPTLCWKPVESFLSTKHRHRVSSEGVGKTELLVSVRYLSLKLPDSLVLDIHHGDSVLHYLG